MNRLSIWRKEHNSLFRALLNSFPLSVIRMAMGPNKLIHALKIAEATVLASLLGRAMALVNFVNASVTTRIQVLPEAVLRRGPNKSAWTRWLGRSGVSRGLNGANRVWCWNGSLVIWHVWQDFMKLAMSAAIESHQ